MERQDADTPTAHDQMCRTIVCLYSQADESFYLQLKKSLNLWERQGQVRWLEVLPGDEPAATWQSDVKRADLILFLLSPDFFSDDLCYQTMHLAIQERTSRQVPVVPVLIRAVDWRASACKDLFAVPRNEQPVASWTSRDEAFASIGADLARLLPAWGLLISTRSMLFRVPDLPEGYVPRPAAFQEIKNILLEKRMGQAMAITTALRGAGGFGKTTLAMSLCHDPDIQAAFPEMIWVELGEKPPRALDLLNRLLALLEGSPIEAITLQEARERWSVALRDRVCLLVIDDVWQAEALLPLLEGGPQCVRLVTTRNDLLLPKDAARVLVDAMNQREAFSLLCQDKHLPAEIFQARYQPQLEALVERLGCWPLLLTLARGMLTDLVVEYHLSIVEALTSIAEAYQTRGVTAFRLDNVEERQRTVEACLNVSVQHLETFTPPHYHAIERYQELAVFPEDTDIPLTTLQIYWKGSTGLEPWETKDLCTRLHRLSLLLICDLGKGTIRLHDVLRSYLIQRAGSHLPAFHGHLLDVHQQEYGLTRWADLPRSEAYLWQHLILHLCLAGHREALQDTLTDLSYLTRKALYVSVSALETDSLLASTSQPVDTVVPSLSLFASLHRIIVRNSHLLQRVHLPSEMGGLLLSYLGSHPLFVAQKDVLEQTLPRPFLTVWHALPQRESSALRRTLNGHTSSVYGCTVSPDGRSIISASGDQTLKVWDIASGAERLTLRGHTSWVYDCAISADGRFIISASLDQTLKVWDAQTGAELRTLRGHKKSVTGCMISADGRFIVSASDDKTLKVWDTATGVELRTLKGHKKSVTGCMISADGRFIVSASKDHTLKVWEAATGTERFTLRGHTDSVTGCAISADGRFIVSASKDHTLKVWDTATGVELRTLSGHTGSVSGCAVSADGRFIISASLDQTLKVWDAQTGAEWFTLRGHTEGLTSCAVSDDGRFIASTSTERRLKVWDITTAGADEHLVFQDSSLGCAVSNDGCLIVSTSTDSTLKVWDAATGAQFLTLRGHTDWVTGCAVSPDGRWIVSASLDQTLKVWDAATGAQLLTLRGHTHSIDGCAVSPDGSFIVSASSDHTLKVWDAMTGTERITLKGHTGNVSGCAVSPDGRTIISASHDCTLKVWDVVTGVEQSTLRGHTRYVIGCAVSPDGRFIISASEDQTLKVWIAQAGRCLLTFPVDGALYGCMFHPDGEHLVACGQHGVYFLRMVM